MSKLRLLVLLSVVLSVFFSVQLVLAVSDPDSIDLLSIRVYENVYEEGDWLILCEHDVAYSSTPVEAANATFCLVLRNGINITAVGYVVEYNHHIGTIYLDSSSVDNLGLTWGNTTYNVSVMGHPDYFTNLTEGVNMSTTVLTAGYWIEGETDESRDYLGNRVIVLAKYLEADWGIDLVNSENELNCEGREEVLKAVLYLDVICPDIFAPCSVIPGYTPPDYDPEYEDTLLSRTGVRLTTALNGLGLWITGKPSMGLLFGGLGLAILYFILAGRIFVATGSVPASIAISIPFLIGGNLVGILPLSITFIAAFFAALSFGVTYIIGRL